MIELTKPLHLQVCGASERRFVTVKRYGAEFDLGGDGTIELFRVGVLAESVDRTPDRVVEWEKTRLLPPPLFKVEGVRWRYYSASQLENVNRIALARFRGRRYVGATGELERFFDDVWRIWYQPDVVVDEHGRLDASKIRGDLRCPQPGSKP